MNFILFIIILLLSIVWFVDHQHQKAIIKELKATLDSNEHLLDMLYLRKKQVLHIMDEFEKRALESHEEDKYYPIHHSL